jgi:response regulator of citrate/malate metabolism
MAEIELLSQAQIDDLQRQMLENEQAKERGEPLPHVITKETMRLAVQSLRAMRGTVRTASKGKAKGVNVAIDLDDLV